MSHPLTTLAIDLGAESGRVMAVHFNGHTLALEELHRFPNPSVTIHGTLHWDFLRLWSDIRAGIEKGKALKPVSLGVDTWGVDFGLLDAQGRLIGNPVHYRDKRTEGMMEKVFARVPRAEVFAQTGIQFMQINTLYQLMSLVGSPQLSIAHTFLTAPDLLNYWLTGAKVCEFSNATTTQLFNPTTGTWATEMMTKLDIPTHIFPEIVAPGTRLGTYEGIPVIAPACHDTGSAVAAMPALSRVVGNSVEGPAQTPHAGYISSGTWSLAGLEIPHPILTPAALAANVTNEGGVNGYRLLKNVMGLWIVQQCRAGWQAEGRAYTYAELAQLAETAQPFKAVINVNDPRFLSHGDHPARIRDFCAETGQPIPQTPGETIRTVLEGLALAYRDVFEKLTTLANQPLDVIHILGGGSQNALLNQMTADAIGKPVLAGPVEATVLGNALVQFLALGEIATLAEARQLIAQMDGMRYFAPNPSPVWNEAFEIYKHLTE
ncbi:MAG: rhamnulokinase family protein [Anaerolineales bacterium]